MKMLEISPQTMKEFDETIARAEKRLREVMAWPELDEVSVTMNFKKGFPTVTKVVMKRFEQNSFILHHGEQPS